MACKSDPKRRRRRRIGKRGRELVFKITAFTPPSDYCVGFNETQPPRSSSQSLLITHARLSHAVFFCFFLSGPFCQWARDEPRTQTQKGRKWNQYVCCPEPPPPRPSAAARGAKMLTSLPRFFQKQREPSLRVSAVGRERERQEVQIVQQREGRVGETWAHVLRGQKGHPPPPFVDTRQSLCPLTLTWARLVSAAGVPARERQIWKERKERQHRRKGREKAISLNGTPHNSP